MTQTGGDPIADIPGVPVGPATGPLEPGATVPPPDPELGSEAAPEADEGEQKASLGRTIWEWARVLGAALILAVLIRNYVFTTFWIPSPSMQPTLVGDLNPSGRHDRVVVNRLSYKFHSVHRGDIIVFTTPKTETPVTENGQRIKDLIKRVVGLPGETVSLRDDHVFINGRELSEPYLPAGTKTDAICPLGSVFKVPKGSVLVMGDNRTNSEDGRCFGPIKESTIIGRAFIRIWPITKITWL